MAVVVGMSLAMCVYTEFILSTDASFGGCLVVLLRVIVGVGECSHVNLRRTHIAVCTFRVIECKYTKARYLLLEDYAIPMN